jgi:hypothetical protein
MRQLEDSDGEIILKWILRKWDSEVQTGFVWLRIGIWLNLVNAVMNIKAVMNLQF